jgi:hypothetical protein
MELQFFRLLLLLLPLGGVAYLVHFLAFADPAPPVIGLGQIQGVVEHRSAGDDWRRADSEMPVRPGDVIRSGRGSSVVLRLPGGAGTVMLGEDGEVAVAQLEETSHGLRLLRGSLTAQIAPDPHRVVRLEVDPAPDVVESVGGQFTLESSGRGDLRLHSLDGEVRFSEAGQSRRLRPGEEIVRQRGPRAPAPAAIPSTVILKANWPKQTARPKPTRPPHAAASVVGAVVTVHGVYVGQRPERVTPAGAGLPPSPPPAPAKEPARPPAGTRKAAPTPDRPSPPPLRPPPPGPQTPPKEPPVLEQPRVHVPSWD